MGELLGGQGSAADALLALVTELGLPTRLEEVGIEPRDFQAIAELTMHDRGVRSNPRPITGPDDIVEILTLAA